MTAFTLKQEKELPEEQLMNLFLSVGWESGKHPDRLVKAMRGSHSVMTVWDDHRLVGLMNALSDGEMTVYYHYLLVDPVYQMKGVGSMLVDAMKKKYQTCLRQVLIAYDDAIPFYLKHGFLAGEGRAPLQIAAF